MTTWLRRFWRNAPRPSTYTPTHKPRLALESMEAREVPAVLGETGIALVSYGGSGDATAELLNTATGAPIVPAFHPFPGFRGAITAASGDVNGDGVPDLIIAAQGAGGFVEVIDGATQSVQSAQFVFPGYNGPVSIGAGDITGNGYDDVLISASLPGLPTGAIDVRTGAVVDAFLALPGSTAPTSVTGVDLYGNGRDEFVVGVGGAVGVFGADGGLLGAVFAYPGSTGPVSVAAGDLTGDGLGDIVVGSAPGAPPEVKIYSGPGLGLISDFQPFDPSLTTGVDVHVATGSNGAPDVFVSPRGFGTVAVVGFTGASSLPLGATGGGGSGTYSGSDSGSSNDNSNNYTNNTPQIPPPYTGDPGTTSTPPTDTGDGSDSGSYSGSGDDGSYDSGDDGDSGYDSGDSGDSGSDDSGDNTGDPDYGN